MTFSEQGPKAVQIIGRLLFCVVPHQVRLAADTI